MSMTQPQTAQKPETSNGLAVAAISTGGVAFLVGWVPILGLIVGLAAIVLAVIALVKKQQKVLSYIGLGLGALATLTSLITTIIFAIGISNADTPEVTSNGSSTAEAPVAPQETEAPPVEESSEPVEPTSTAADAEALWLEMHGVNAATEFITQEGYENSLENPLYAVVPGWGGDTDGFLRVTVQEHISDDAAKRVGINILNFIGPSYPDLVGVVITDASGLDHNVFRRDAPLADG